jgi:hypothetical protein
MRIAAVLALAAMLGACGSGELATERAPPQPSGVLYLKHLREPKITRIDLATGRETSAAFPELSPGDPPFNMILTGGRLVAYGRENTWAIDPGLQHDPVDIGRSWYFVPSATQGRVWLTTLDPSSPATRRDLSVVREVTVDGRVTVPPGARPAGWVDLATTAGMIVNAPANLEVWDPVTGDVRLRVPGPFPAATRGALLAWCPSGCHRLHVTDARTGNDRAIPPAEGSRFEETYDAAFSPDGRWLATPAVTGGRERLALVEVATGVARIVPGSRLDAYRQIAWSPAGDWVFFGAPGRGLMAYHPGAEAALRLPVRAPAPFVEMAAG